MLSCRGLVNLNFKTKIRYNGQEYSDPRELPPEVRVAYEKANVGEQFESGTDMPEPERKLYDDVLGAIENNGEVTLPGAEKTEPLLTKRELVVVALLGLGLASLIVARIVS